MSSQQENLWTSCANTPKELRYGIASRWSGNEFVIASNSLSTFSFDHEERTGVYRYSAITDKWDLLVKYPKLFYALNVQSVAVDPDRHRMYISGKNYPLMICYTKAKMVRTEIRNMPRRVSSEKAAMVAADGSLHCLDATSFADAEKRFSKTHSIDCVKSNKMEYVSTFDSVVEASNFRTVQTSQDRRGPRCLNLSGIQLVHVPSQNVILLIGDKKSGDIWKYDIDSKSWTSAGIQFANVPHCAVLTASEKHVVIGAHDRIYQIYGPRKLFILDIQDPSKYRLYRCSIECPTSSLYMLSVTGGGVHGELLVIGWIKDLLRTEDLNASQLPPLYLLQSIAVWLSCELLHWIDGWSGEHYAIEMHHIISSMVDSSD